MKLAQMLVEHSFADKVFFCNGGAEANEAAIKLARRYSHDKYGAGRFEIVTMKNSFHGRTMATLTATGQDKVQKGYEPLLPGFGLPASGFSASWLITRNQIPGITRARESRCLRRFGRQPGTGPARSSARTERRRTRIY